MTYSGDSGVQPDRFKEIWDRIGILRDDLNGLRSWGVNMEGRIGSCRTGLNDLEDSARNMFSDFADYKRQTTMQIAALEERLAKLEGGGDDDDG